MRPYYQDGSVTIYLGDQAEIVPTLGDVDHVFSDPPYDSKFTHGAHLSKVKLYGPRPCHKGLNFDGISSGDMVALACQWVAIARRWVVFTCDWHFMTDLEDAGLLVRFGVWRKPDGAPQLTGDRPGMGWEGIAICHRAGRKKWNGGGRHAFYTYAKRENTSGHPTGKPLGLFKELIADFTDPEALILDPFAGSGTTGLAAKLMGRRAILIERDEKWAEVAARRCSQEVLF